MKDSLNLYITKIDALLNQKEIKNIVKVKEELLLQIKIFQHERLVHLFVTIFVGLATILFLLFALLLEKTTLFILFFLCLLLFIPYIFHYYYLENGVQKLYQKYWELNTRHS